MLEVRHEKRIERLLSSWSLRAQPGAPGEDTALVLQNIAAVQNALAAARSVRAVDEIRAPLEQLHRDIRRQIRRRQVSPRDLIDYNRKIERALLALKDIG